MLYRFSVIHRNPRVGASTPSSGIPAALLAAFVREIERHVTGAPGTVFDPTDRASQKLDEHDKAGGKLSATDPRRSSTIPADTMEKLFGTPRPEAWSRR